MSTDTDVQTAAATQLDEDGASSAVSPTLGAAVVLAKYPTLLLVVLAVGVLSRDIEPPLDYAIPDSSPAANSSAEGLSRNEIRTTARAAKDENNKAGSTTATNRVFQIPNDERAKASSRYAAAKEDENKQTAYQNALYARLLEMGETNDLIRILKEERKEAEGEGDEGEVERIKARLKSLKRKRDGTSDKEMPGSCAGTACAAPRARPPPPAATPRHRPSARLTAPRSAASAGCRAWATQGSPPPARRGPPGPGGWTARLPPLRIRRSTPLLPSPRCCRRISRLPSPGGAPAAAPRRRCGTGA